MVVVLRCHRRSGTVYLPLFFHRQVSTLVSVFSLQRARYRSFKRANIDDVLVRSDAGRHDNSCVSSSRQLLAFLYPDVDRILESRPDIAGAQKCNGVIPAMDLEVEFFLRNFRGLDK